MTEEHPRISKRDWRLQGITTLAQDFKSPWSGILHKVGAPVEIAGFVRFKGEITQIPVPNPSAIYISLARRSVENTAENLRILGEKIVKRSNNTSAFSNEYEIQFFNELENLIACVVFSHTAIEAFANESIPDDYKFEKMRGDKRCVEIYSKDQIERNLSLDTKLDEILPTLFAVQSPKGTKLWENYAWLKEIRDRFVHLKSTDWKHSTPENADQYVWTNLLSGRVQEGPKIAVELIHHYQKQKPPRWLAKALEVLK